MCYISALVLKYCTHIANSQGKIVKTFVTNIANCGNICDKYCAHYPLSQVCWLNCTIITYTGPVFKYQLSLFLKYPAQAIRDCLSDRNSLSLSQTTSNPFWQKTSVQPNSHSVTVQIPHKMTFEKCTNFSWDQTLSQFAFRTSSIPLKLIWSLQN